MKGVSIALVHHPVLNKNGETICSAVTNLDLHDIARAAKTYGVDNYYLVTPLKDQQELVVEIAEHWKNGYGASYNPARKQAMSIVHMAESVDNTIDSLTEFYGQKPLVVITSARSYDNSISYAALKKKREDGIPCLLLFGTAHGLAPELITKADEILLPVGGGTEYNHLSVRSAASIILDRLLGE